MIDNSFSITVASYPAQATANSPESQARWASTSPDGKHTYNFEYTLPAEK